MGENPKVGLNNYCTKYKCSPSWTEDSGGQDKQGCKSWVMVLTVPTPDGSCVEATGTASSKKDAETQAAAQCMVQLRDAGLLKDVKGCGFAVNETSVEVSRKRAATTMEALLADEPEPLALEAPKALATPGDNSKVVLNNYCMKHKVKPEWRCTTLAPPPLGKTWTMALKVVTPEGLVVEKEGTATSKKEAEMIAAAAFLTELQGLGLVSDLDFTAQPISEPAVKRVNSEPGAKRVKVQGMQEVLPVGELERAPDAPPIVAAPLMVAPQPELVNTYGYSTAVARAQLNQYFRKRGAPVEIPCEGVGPLGAGPFLARVELPDPRGGPPVCVCAEASKKAEAINQAALRMCVELCKRGDLPPFQTKAQVLEEGLQPCEAPLDPVLEQRMDCVLAAFGVDTGSGALPPGQSLQMDFDASPWAMEVNESQISWEPPTWGRSPWEDGEVNLGGEEEVSAALRLAAEQEIWEATMQHRTIRAQRNILPVNAVSEQIITAINSSPVTLISGSTGCGKTTQVPQLLLERAISGGEATKLNVVCTQPRRIAAISVAERVAAERGEQVGQSIGFSVRFCQAVPRGYASVCYMTTGMLLRRMTSNGLRGVSHIIVDEVHERDLDTDFLIVVLKQLVQQCVSLRVVLMSATINIAKWAAYFGPGFGTVVEIPGRLFHVDVHYLEDALRMASIPGELVRQAKPHEEIPTEVVVHLLDFLVRESSKKDRGAILVFLPGWETITSLQTRIRKDATLSRRVCLHLLHSQVPKDEQQAAFLPAPAPQVKVILSTNIAESSITISDVVYVVDSCRVKQLVPSQSPGGRIAHRLTSTAASKESLQQRAGRAGRLREGVCFRLISRSAFAKLPESLLPEMVRMPLHQVTLLLKSLNLGHAASFLALAPDPPPASSVHRAVAILQDLKALDTMENITVLGHQLAKLPIEPRMAFALLTGCVLGIGEPVAVLGALSAAPSLYQNEVRRGRELSAWKDTSTSQKLLSEHHDMLVSYYRLRDMSLDQAMMTCHREYLNFKVFKQVSEAADQTLGILRHMGFNTLAIGCCKTWVREMGTPAEGPQHRLNWAALTFVLGMGLEHFAAWKGLSRKVWVGAGKTSQVSTSPGIPEVPPLDPLRPFLVFGEMQESEWSSSCRGVTAAGALATLLGAARELKYDHARGCVMLDGWAPVKLSYQSAARLGAMRAALRVCLLNLAKEPATRQTWDDMVAEFVHLLLELCTPSF